MEVVFGTGEKISTEHGQLNCSALQFPFARCALQSVPVKNARTLVQTDDAAGKRVLEITLNIRAQPDLQDFQPGDTLAILPHNSVEDVTHLLDAMQLTAHAQRICKVQASPIGKKPLKVPPHIPNGDTTPLELLRDCLSLRALPKKQLLRCLADSCTDAAQRDALNILAAKEGAATYKELILERGLTLMDLLQMYPSCRPTLALLVEQLPRLLPRPYSVANSPLESNNELRLVFSIRNVQPGITTQMLDKKAQQCNEDAPPKLLVYLRDFNRFRYTETEAYTTNQVLIAIGTGVAPFIGFLQHKQCLATGATAGGQELGQTWLFVGATKESCLPQRAELQQFHAVGVLNEYYESFSRSATTETTDAHYRYVQDQMLAHANDLVAFLMLPATVLYVCADGAEISRSIEAALVACLQKAMPDQGDDNAKQLLQQFRQSGKYREDVWA